MKRQRLEDVTFRIDFTAVGLFLFLLTALYYHIMVSLPAGTMILVVCSFLVLCLICLPRLPQMFTASSFRMLFWIGAAVIICMNNGYLEHQYLVYFFSLPLAILVAYSLQYGTGWHNAFLKVFRFFVLSHLVLGWLFWLLPGLYTSKIIPMFSADVRGDLLRWSNQHVLMGLTAHYSASGVFCAFGVIYFAASWLSRERKEQDLTMLLLMVISLMMTQKRGPLLFAVATVVLLYFLANQISFDIIMKFCMIGAAAVIFLLLIIKYLPDMQRVIDRFFEDGDVTNGRGDLYAYALELFRSHKLLGVGWGQYRFLPGSGGLQVHNIYLQILAETGIIGSLLVYSGFGACVFSTVRNIIEIKRNTADKQQQCVPFPLVFSAAMQIYFLLYGLTGNPIYDITCIYPYFLAVALNESYIVEKHSNMVTNNRSIENENRHSNIRRYQ